MTSFMEQVREMSERMIAAHQERPDLADSRRFDSAAGIGNAIPVDEFLQTGHNELVSLVGTGVQDIARTLYQMNWTILHAPSGEHFITSDNPVSRENPTVSNPLQQADLEIPGIEVAIPVTKSCCLVMSYHGPEGHLQSDPQMVRVINDRTLRCFDAEIYSSRNERWIANHIFGESKQK